MVWRGFPFTFCKSDDCRIMGPLMLGAAWNPTRHVPVKRPGRSFGVGGDGHQPVKNIGNSLDVGQSN